MVFLFSRPPSLRDRRSRWRARLKNIKLHNKILIALGAIFGALFSVSKYRLEITYHEGKAERTTIIENWERIDFKKKTGEVIASFGKEDQLKLSTFPRSAWECAWE